MNRPRWIIANLLMALIAIVVYVASVNLSGNSTQSIIAGLLVFIVASSIYNYCSNRFYTRYFDAIKMGLLHLQDGEFSISLPHQYHSSINSLSELFNQIVGRLRQERSSLMQRELLLDRVFETVSSAFLLTDSHEKVVLCNLAARQLLNKGKPIKGTPLPVLVEQLAAPLAESIHQKKDVLFSIEGDDGEPETWHLDCENFYINGQEHCLFHFKSMTKTLSRAEVNTWKKVIRVLSHEINNSLAPISSLSHSGKQIVSSQVFNENNMNLLMNIFSTLNERAEHLKIFISDYAQFSRLPSPKQEATDWQAFMCGIQTLTPFTYVAQNYQRKGFIDAAQFSQVMINLVKNSLEAGATPEGIHVSIIQQTEWDQLTISDKGTGMNDEQLKQALLPFYSTKRNNSGIGLSLCREIIDAHNGRIKLSNNKDGGLQVTIWLPALTH